MSRWKQDTRKLRELIVFIAQRTADDAVGDIFLNKVLFFSDAWALQHLGEPITGSRYQKQPLGPTSRPLLPLRREMIERREVDVETIDKRTVTRALREPDLSRFSEDEVKLVERVIDLFRGSSAMRVSDESHNLSPGWNLVELGEEIPLEPQPSKPRERIGLEVAAIVAARVLGEPAAPVALVPHRRGRSRRSGCRA